MWHKEFGAGIHNYLKNPTTTSELFTFEFVVNDATLEKEKQFTIVADFSGEEVFMGISAPDVNFKDYREMTPSPLYKDLQQVLKFIANELTQMRKNGETEKF